MAEDRQDAQPAATDGKRRYRRPRLVRYGAIRNLTGGSGGTRGDGGLNMTRAKL